MAVEMVLVEKRGDRCVIRSAEGSGGLLLDGKGVARTYAKTSNAIRFLRSTGLPYLAELPSGVVREVNCDKERDSGKYGPHHWSKVNLITISDGSGMYDLLRCEHCGEKRKRYGFAGLAGGVCLKNPLETEESVD